MSHVLVVDDDPVIADLVAFRLSRLGLEVSVESDGEAGLAAARQLRPDLVVLDFIMPGLSGADVASRILSKQPEQAILFVSGYSETDSIRRIAPHAPLLTKPFRAEALAKAVRGALAKVEQA